MSLYRKYRPQTFSEIIGQPQVSDSLLKQLETGKISHAYLFSGPRGTGKTSTARIFAKAVNCEKYTRDTFGEPCNKCATCQAITQGSYLDVLEIDAASNRGIDEIRDLREKIRLAPIGGKFKVYIIDEVHMLTNEAFNALLKTLEEPPEHAIFILATTELHKVPATIQSRTQKFQFELPTREKITSKLSKIVEAEGYGLPQESLEVIAIVSEAAYRDAEVLLEKVATVNPKALREEVEQILGFQNLKPDVLNLLLAKDTKGTILWLGDRLESGANPKVLTEYLISLFRSVLMLKMKIDQRQLNFPPETLQKLEEFSQRIDTKKLSEWIEIFVKSLTELKDSPIPQLPLELAIIEACEFNESSGGEVEVVAEKLEEKQEVKVEKEVEVEEASTPKEVKVETVPPEPQESVKAVKKDKTEVKSIAQIQEKWSDILKGVKPHNNSVEIFLRRATPISMEEGLITLETGYAFHKDMLEETKNNQILERVFSEVLGRPVRIKVTVGEKKARPKVEKPEDNPLDEADPVEVFGKLV